MTDAKMTQELLEMIGVVYDSISDASCLLYDLVEENPMLRDIQKIKELQSKLNKAINKIENDMP